MTEHFPTGAETSASLSKKNLPEGSRLMPSDNTSISSKWHTAASSSDMRSRGLARGRLQNGVSAESIRRAAGSRMCQDTRRYMQAAAASRQNTVHQLLNRLQTYRTFQPFISPPASYRTGSFAQEQPISSPTSFSRRRKSAAVVSSSQLWQMVDRVLDTSVAQMLQHNAESNFIMTLESALGLEAGTSMEKIRTVVESRKPGSTANGEVTSESTNEERAPHRGSRQSQLAASTKFAARSSFQSLNPFFDRWNAERGYTTAAEVEEQRNAWLMFDQERHRRGRLLYLQAMKDELDMLQGGETRDVADSNDALDTISQSGRSHGTAVQAFNDEEAAAKAEGEKQRTLWHTFRDSPVQAVGARRSSYDTAKGAPQIVSAYLECADLKDWLYSSWAHRTHRHESAALRIQCAYRVYRARHEVLSRRYERRQSFLSGLHTEKEAQRIWDLALQVKTEPVTIVTGADATMRALHFFMDKVNAVIAKRRARKKYQQHQDDEIQNYAATRIQAVYRGHRARLFVMELRYPEIAAHRRQLRCEKYATLIQACWRRYTAQRRWWRVRHAVSVLQGAYRCHAARTMLAVRRYKRDLAAAEELNKCALQRIGQWYASRLAVRTAIGSKHMTELLILQRICRGYQGRQQIHKQARLIRLRCAVRIIEEHRQDVLKVRRAIEMMTALRAASAAKRTALVRHDAALTIQRAWRQLHIPFLE
ncbi:hypothetical protein JKF63_05525 [Porcisia hertigi]|uniref:Uncharacterized protein n=1 Tax=Porcisia hertigi TaxID=2761500 RepID=A0A836IF31_9TRYP|nr:hypothetical protein JKF63_05525 [Porcisia hertigi]